jgi:hypothetical protein
VLRASIEAEKLGIPSVSVIVPMFYKQAQLVARGKGFPGISLALYPEDAIDNHSAAHVQANVARMFDSIVDGWTKPVQPESSGGGAGAADPRQVVFKGSFREVNDFFYESKWTDGLPIVPPTVAAVEEMLEWTDFLPDEEIAVLPMANLKATSRNIAVNAVMAGCRPEYMPLLIAAVEAFSEPDYQLKDLGSTSSIKPLIVVNGPIIKQLDINHGTSLMALGRKSNSTIGRALGLITRNIAGFREGETWMGCFGWPGSPAVMAEDEQLTPWEPYHVERGFDRNASTVTAMMARNATYQMMSAGDTAEPHLTALCYNMGKAFDITFLDAGEDHASMNVFISPANAKVIAKDGYTKEAVKEYLARNSTLTVSEIDTEKRITFSHKDTVHKMATEGKIPREWDRGPDDRIPFIRSPKMLHVVVCGSPQRNRNLIIRANYCTPVTREIKLPKRWNLK